MIHHLDITYINHGNIKINIKFIINLLIDINLPSRSNSSDKSNHNSSHKYKSPHTTATRETMIPTLNSIKFTHNTIQHHTHTVVVIQAQFADAELGESVRKEDKEK